VAAAPDASAITTIGIAAIAKKSSESPTSSVRRAVSTPSRRGLSRARRIKLSESDEGVCGIERS
jgi:hypothetical protein